MGTDNNNWRELSEKQKKTALYLLEPYVKVKIVISAVSIIAIFGYLIILAIHTDLGSHIRSANRINIILTLILAMLLILLIAIFTYQIRKDLGKIKAIKSGTARITEVTVISKRIKRISSRSHSFRVTVKDLFGAQMEITVLRRQYNTIFNNDKGYAIRFDPDGNNKSPNSHWYIPRY